MTHVAADFPKVSCTVRLKRFWYEGERLAANHARGHNLIHPEVAGDRTT